MEGLRQEECLRQHFGLAAFRPLQREAIAATLVEKRDVLLIMPTGGGKSLVFQFPAVLSEKLTVVISPLIALAADQVRALEDRGIEAATWNSQSSDRERSRITSALAEEDDEGLRLLYTTPESLCTPELQELLAKAAGHGKLLSFAIDEAHCATAWGHGAQLSCPESAASGKVLTQDTQGNNSSSPPCRFPALLSQAGRPAAGLPRRPRHCRDGDGHRDRPERHHRRAAAHEASGFYHIFQPAEHRVPGPAQGAAGGRFQGGLP